MRTQFVWARKKRSLWVDYLLFWFSGIWFLPALFSFDTAGLDHRMTLTILPGVILPLIAVLWRRWMWD